MTELLERIIIEPKQKATASVIWLHGLGASGHDFESSIPYLELGDTHSVRFIFPHAPERRVTMNAGMMMRAWYDLQSLNLTQQQDAVGIHASANAINNLLEDQETSGIDPSRILLLGFSQGSAMALHCGLRYPRRLGGVASLSGYIALESYLAKERASVNQTVPIFIGHGLFDPIVPHLLGKQSHELLEQLGYNVCFNSYPMAHMVCLPELKDLGSWIKAALQ